MGYEFLYFYQSTIAVDGEVLFIQLMSFKLSIIRLVYFLALSRLIQ